MGRRTLLLGFAGFYLLLTVFDLMRGRASVQDSIVAVIALLTLYLLSSRWRMSDLSIIIAGCVFLPNAIGQLGGYSLAIFNYHFDWIVHFVTAMMGGIGITAFLMDNTRLSKRRSAVAAFLITIAFGATVEIMEYWGFVFFGFGDGYLGFASGDNSRNFGPWENSSLDLTINFIGASLGAMSVVFFRNPALSHHATKQSV